MQDHPIILFDGVCNFCNSAVNFVIKRDPQSKFRFATLQSEKAHEVLSAHQLSSSDLSSFVLIKDDKIYTRSTAALKVCRGLSGLWPMMYGFMIVPRFIRDGVYNWIARHRYQWFGKRETCMIPTNDLRSRFLNEPI
ncbi:MAG: thiol-disulfide oxidoreductase DCC family protein [Ginsengibacter sp.]|jgi:predicted DCC family thiol-disulfide oxidoreductase YuxK